MTTVFLPGAQEAAGIERTTAGEMLRRWSSEAMDRHTALILRLAADCIERGHHYRAPAELNRKPRISGTLDRDMLTFLTRQGGHWKGSTYDLSLKVRTHQTSVQNCLRRLEKAGLLTWRRRVGRPSEISLRPLASAVDMGGQG